MNRFLAWWRGTPRLHVHFVRPGRETNPLAEQALEGFQQAVESLQRANESVERCLGLVNDLGGQLARSRAELAAYAAASMEPDAQVAELERMQTPNAD